jgi:ribokinase
MRRRTLILGPAYLDRVLMTDRPLVEPGTSPSLDQSVEGSWTFGPGLIFRDPAGSILEVTPPDDWLGPTGEVAVDRRLGGGPGGWRRTVRGVSWHDDLGGMGAGYATALGGTLVSALGPEDDPVSRSVADRLRAEGVEHRPIRVRDRPADWTLLVSSGRFGDKLPVGFRGCHAALAPRDVRKAAAEPAELRVVASLPNRLAAEALRAPGANVRVFAPAVRNMTDRADPVATFAEWIDVLCCNRREWELLEDREQVAWQVSLLVITDGPAGSVVRFTTPEGEAGRVAVPAFPRAHPPRDTNRAGETYAATLLATLLDQGWTPGVSDPALVQIAAERASAAAALVLDRERFGFPDPAEVVAALREGRVGGEEPCAGGTESRYNPRTQGPEPGRGSR